MTDEATKLFGDFTKLLEQCEAENISLPVLHALLDKKNTAFADMTVDERTQLYSYLFERLHWLRLSIPLMLDSPIWLLDIDQATITTLYDHGTITIELLLERTDPENPAEWDLGLEPDKLGHLREEIKSRLSDKEGSATKRPPIEESFNKGN